MKSPKSEPFSPWLKYSQKNRRDEKMSALWVRPLIEWILHSSTPKPFQSHKAHILDFGCGYLDAGIGLQSLASQIDGFDIDPIARQIAADRLRTLHLTGHIHENLASIPKKTYDLIIINSVLQYLKDSVELQAYLHHIFGFIKPSGMILVSDLIPPTYSPVKDGIFSIMHATINGCFLPMISHLLKASTKQKSLKLLKVTFDDLADFASENGFICKKLPKNLTPSPYRYSVIILKS